MFFLVLLFLIFASFASILRFPNLFSKFRRYLPRINLSRYFRNPKIKTLLQDRYFFNQSAPHLSSNPLFIIFGKGVEQIFDKLDPRLKTCEKPWSQRGDQEAFGIIELYGSKFLFVHPDLIKSHNDETLNSRLRFLIKRLCKVRRQIYINGIIFTVDHITSSFDNNASKLTTIRHNALLHSYVFQEFSRFFRIRLPAFFLTTEQIEAKCSSVYEAMSFNDSIEDFFGFYCDFSKEKTIQACHHAVECKYQSFQEHLNLHVNFKLEKTDRSETSLSVLNNIHRVKVETSSLIQFQIKYFLECFEESTQNLPGSVSILNLRLFKSDNFTCESEALLAYIAQHARNMIIISDQLLDRRSKINFIFSVCSLCAFSFFTFSLIKSDKDLSKQRTEIERITENFEILESFIHLSKSHKNISDDKSLEFTDLTCQIVHDYEKLKNSDLHSYYLFPSWNSQISSKIQNKYKIKFSHIFSEFLIQTYLSQARFKLENSSSELNQAHPRDVSNIFKNYVLYFQSFSENYDQIVSNDPGQIGKGLQAIAHNVYSPECLNQEFFNDFLESVSTNSLIEFKRFHNYLKQTLSNQMTELANVYFNKTLVNSSLMSAAFKLSHDINEFEQLALQSTGTSQFFQDNNELINKKQALFKSVEDYNTLSEEFSQINTKSTASKSDFLDIEYENVLKNIKHNKLLDRQLHIKIDEIANVSFQNFKKQITSLASLQAKAQYPILSFGEKNEISIHPNIQNLFQTFIKINEIYPDHIIKAENSDTTLGIYDDRDQKTHQNLHTLAFDKSQKFLWEPKKLEFAWRMHEQFDKEYENFDFDLYPEAISNALKQVLFMLSEKKFSEHLALALHKESLNSYNDEYDLTIDSYGLTVNGPFFEKIFSHLATERYKRIFSDLTEIIMTQSNDFLSQKLLELERKNLLLEPDLDLNSWNGKTSPAHLVFHTNSDEKLRLLLEGNHQKLYDFYSEYVQKFMKSMSPSMKMIPKQHIGPYNFWYSVFLNFENKVKSYQAFETYIFSEFSQFRSEKCNDLIDSFVSTAEPFDYFDQQKRRIESKLYNFCYTSYIISARESYNEVADLFNRKIAGKYPFSQHIPPNSREGIVENTDLLLLFEKLKFFEENNMSFLLSHYHEFSERKDILDFIKQVRQLKSIVTKKSLDNNATPALGLNAQFHFRKSRKGERLANRIVDWELKIGDKNYGSQYGQLKNATILFNNDETLRFTLRFADQTRLKPIRSNSSGILISTQKNMLTYTLTESWALLRFIDEQEDCQESNLPCSREKLKFSIPLADSTSAVFFCDIKLLNNSGKIASFPVLPDIAPQLE